MEGHFTTNSFQELSGKLQASLNWLRQLGITPNPTRLGEYDRLLKRLVKSQEAKDEGALQADFAVFTNMLFEIHELIDIHSALAGKYDAEISKQVKTFAGGPTSYLLEDVATSSNRARDFGFELALMAALSRATLPLDFTIQTDVAAGFEQRTLMFECKRPQSADSVPRLARKAADQLRGKYKSFSRRNRRGIIALDVTKVINPEFKILVGKENAHIDQIMSQKLVELMRENEEEWAKMRDSRTIGVLFRLRQMNAIEGSDSSRLVYGNLYLLTNTAGTGEVDMSLANAFAAAIRQGMHNAV